MGDGQRLLSRRAHDAIASETSGVLISAVVAWEFAIKIRLRKWPEAVPVLADLDNALREENFDPLPITLEHAGIAGALSGPHRDPFDRMLAAQAKVEGVPLVTADPAFRAFDIEVLW